MTSSAAPSLALPARQFQYYFFLSQLTYFVSQVPAFQRLPPLHAAILNFINKYCEGVQDVYLLSFAFMSRAQVRDPRTRHRAIGL
ncbi:hypothetical protein E2C01_027014 [Portunus trituberculatus]|uniref:Uncharacterized protein n=1 Tax=Portunus trituberculatus TaxID=210409 RepID=A0A5B7EK89_PORTR|nr:hypothetical protein [Portunus trituberculatus]